jgi:hypothetical protein
MIEVSAKPRITRQQLAPFLTAHGFPIGPGTIERICSPAQSKGPPVDAWWNGRALYNPDAVLEWAEARLTNQRRSFTRDGSRKPRKAAAAVSAERGA